MVPCRDCGLLTGELNQLCVYCRVRNRFWATADELPTELCGWGVTTLRVWTGILQEEIDKFNETRRAKEGAAQSVRPKSASPGVPSEPVDTPRSGSQVSGADQGKASSRGSPVPGRASKGEEDETKKVDKSWIPVKKEEDWPRTPPSGEVGVVEIEEGEGKHSSSSRVHLEEKKRRRSRRRSTTKSGSRRDRKRKSRTRSRSRHRRRRSSKGSPPKAPPDEKPGEEERKERKAKPSVRPPRTPSRSPPGRHKPPARKPPAHPRPLARPSGRAWQGPGKPLWKYNPRYFGENKGVKKRERHINRSQGDQ